MPPDDHDEAGEPWLSFQGLPAERSYLMAGQTIALWTHDEPRERVC